VRIKRITKKIRRKGTVREGQYFKKIELERENEIRGRNIKR
jgi:hypothetical protein